MGAALIFYFFEYVSRAAPAVMIPDLKSAYAIEAVGISAILGRYAPVAAGEITTIRADERAHEAESSADVEPCASSNERNRAVRIGCPFNQLKGLIYS